jgi:hypothetical protein
MLNKDMNNCLDAKQKYPGFTKSINREAHKESAKNAK